MNPFAEDYKQAIKEFHESDDPTQQLASFVTPGLPIVTSERSNLRGRRGDQSSIQEHYVSKGVLPL